MAAAESPLDAIQLAAQLAFQTRHDPYQFVMRAFPWGEPGTILEREKGPRPWQAEELIALGEHLQGPHRFDPFRSSIASGHGIGKSTYISFLTLWAIQTFPEARGVVTANTENQLRTKTWPEIGKWHALSALRPWFKLDASVFRSAENEFALTWRLDMAPWSESNTEAFAGLHNKGKRIILLADESSGIANRVFEVAQGAMTDENTEIVLVLLGNPTRPSGFFFDTHNRMSHRWRTRRIDSRDVEGTNKSLLNEWVHDYGEDSDFVRVRVRGEFPKSASNQLIPSDLIKEASEREVSPQLSDPLIFGVDVARFGDDQSVLYTRRGKCAGIFGSYSWRGLDMIQLADELVQRIEEFHPHYINIDGGGVGGGLVDIMRHRGFDVREVQFGGSPRNPDYRNKRTEMWCDMRDWMRSGGCIPWHDQELIQDLTNQTYTVPELKSNALILTPKETMKRDGLPSPDKGDALALTFAELVAPLQIARRDRPLVPVSERLKYVRRWR